MFALENLEAPRDLKVLDLRREKAERIDEYGSLGARAVLGARGEGKTHVYALYFEPGGRIGRHRAGPAQLFLAVAGSGWVEDGDGVRRVIRTGEAALIERGEVHAKGSDSGMAAVMIQVESLGAAS